MENKLWCQDQKQECQLGGHFNYPSNNASGMEVVAESRISGGDKAGNSASLQGFPGGSYGKASACNMGDLSSIPGSGRSSGEGNGNPLQYPCLENHMDGGAWSATVYGVAKSRTRLSDSTFHFHSLEEEMATHSSVLAWRIPETEEPSGLLSMGSHRVGHD